MNAKYGRSGAAAISNASPVLGLRPVRAGRAGLILVLNVPNAGTRILSVSALVARILNKVSAIKRT